MRSEVKVGLLLVVALVVLASGIWLLGEESNLFRSKNTYSIRFDTVSGLNSGNPVQLNGVDVGEVRRVILPQDPGESEIVVWVSVDQRYAQRIRQDSQARIKTLGLLGDKYVEITSGSPEAPVIPDGGQIPTAPATSVDELLASGEDVMDNVTAITFALREILERTERGEGILGALTSEAGRDVTESLQATLKSVQQLMEKLNQGEGPLGRLLNDREMGDRLESTFARLDRVLTQAEEGDGLLPSLLNDAETKERFDRTLGRLEETVAHLETLSEDLGRGDGLLHKLLQDEEYAEKVSADLEQLLERLNTLAARMTEGDGTVAKLLRDDQLYQALDDILVGINESWMLRWLIRNRQKAGIEERYEDARKEAERRREGPGGQKPAEPDPDGDATKPPADPSRMEEEGTGAVGGGTESRRTAPEDGSTAGTRTREVEQNMEPDTETRTEGGAP